MNAADAQRLSEIKQYRLFLPLGALDNPLVRFTEPRYRSGLSRYLSLLSFRSIDVDKADTIDGSSATATRLSIAKEQTKNLNFDKDENEKPVRRVFAVDKSFRVLREKSDPKERVQAIDFKVHLGQAALPGLLRPELWHRPSFQLRMGRQNGHELRPDTIPPNEIGTDFVQMRYRVPFPLGHPVRQLAFLHDSLKDGVTLDHLNLLWVVNGEVNERIPTDPTPIRPLELLNGAEHYPSRDDNEPLEAVS